MFRYLAFAALVVACGLKFAAAEESVGATEIAPNLVVFATSTGNVIASVGPDGALLVGIPSADSTPRILAC